MLAVSPILILWSLRIEDNCYAKIGLYIDIFAYALAFFFIPAGLSIGFFWFYLRETKTYSDLKKILEESGREDFPDLPRYLAGY
jgi:hypothetical protein